jgi:hypothetical protein
LNARRELLEPIGQATGNSLPERLRLGPPGALRISVDAQLPVPLDACKKFPVLINDRFGGMPQILELLGHLHSLGSRLTYSEPLRVQRLTQPTLKLS